MLWNYNNYSNSKIMSAEYCVCFLKIVSFVNFLVSNINFILINFDLFVIFSDSSSQSFENLELTVTDDVKPDDKIMENVKSTRSRVGETVSAPEITNNNNNRIVSFIVGDEESSENNHTHMNGDALSYEDELVMKEKRDNFDIKPPSGLDSKSSSYKDMFGLAERRKRLR